MQAKHLLNTTELLSLVNDKNSIQEPVIEYDEPLVNFLNQTFNYALECNASDIHIEPYATYCRIRFRVDGLLRNISEIPIQLFHRFSARIKVLAKLDVSEKRLPQDGRISLAINQKKINIRVSICPTLYGEKIVLRFLNLQPNILDINNLGFTTQQREIFLAKISAPQGLILVTGPTGSGKTVTLYSALNYLNSENKNIVSIEDPIEIELPGINQVNIQPKIGLTFKKTLRSFLRQDPDIIMLGEIRDHASAAIAVQAAQTGHLVLATMHAKNTYEAIDRLRNLKISLHDIINSLTLLIAQRLIRKKFKNSYQGRTGIFELLPLSSTLKEFLINNASQKQIYNYMRQNQLTTLQEQGVELVKNNITDINEINRVL